MIGVRTSMKPLAVSLAAMAASNSDRSCLRGLAMRSLMPASFAAFVLDISLANCLSRSSASG